MARQKSQTHVEHSINRDDLALVLQTELNKSRKDGAKVSYFLDEDDNPSEIKDWISTGSTMLDLAISNRPYGGLPVGRIVELSGIEGCVTEDTIIEVIIEESDTAI